MSSEIKTPANSDLNKSKPGLFDAKGAIGQTFTEKGAIGGTAQAVGGPLDKEGIIGKQFTTKGSVGGTVQNVVGGKNEQTN